MLGLSLISAAVRYQAQGRGWHWVGGKGLADRLNPRQSRRSALPAVGNRKPTPPASRSPAD